MSNEKQTQELQRHVDNYFNTIKIIEKENDRLQKHNELLENAYTKLKEAADEMCTNLKEYMIGDHDKIKIVKSIETYKHLTNKP